MAAESSTAAPDGAGPTGGVATTVARVLLGLVFVVTGLNGFFLFIPMESAPTPTKAGIEFSQALAETGYMLPLVSGTQAMCGALLLVGRFVALALVVLAPVVVNIIAFHLLLSPPGMVLALVVVVLEVYLLVAYRRVYAPLLRSR